MIAVSCDAIYITKRGSAANLEGDVAGIFCQALSCGGCGAVSYCSKVGWHTGSVLDDVHD